MKKMFFSAGVILALLVSCETQDELLVEASKSKTDTIANNDTIVKVKPQNPDTIKLPVPDSNADKFNIIYSLDFSKNTQGTYKESEWKIDWNSPSWASNKQGYGTIVQENANKYLKQGFAAGSFMASGGYQWHGKFNKGYNELYLSFKVKFSDGFTNRSLNGKLPGLSGGASNGGGDLPTGNDGWSARYMFHGTEINFYLYHPDIYKATGDTKPIAGKDYYGRGPVLSPGYTLKPGVWYTVTQRIVMNTCGKSDGLVEGFIDGKLCSVLTGIRFRDIPSLQIDRIYFANFFGGSGEPPSKTESISFDDFIVYTYSSSVNIARNNVANQKGTTILIPHLSK